MFKSKGFKLIVYSCFDCKAELPWNPALCEDMRRAKWWRMNKYDDNNYPSVPQQFLSDITSWHIYSFSESTGNDIAQIHEMQSN